MLAALKAFIHAILAPTLYAGMWGTFLASVFKRAEWALYLLVILTPLPVIWYRLHNFPLGTSTLDILVFGAFLGVLINKQGFQKGPSTWLIAMFIFINYLALWNTTLRFDLPLPFTTSNPQLSSWKNYIEMIFLYFIAYNIIRSEEQQKTLVIIMATVIFLIMLRETRNFTAGTSFSYDKRAEGPFWIVGLGANHFGAFIAHYCSLLFGLFLVDKHRYRKWLYLGAAAFSVSPLFFAYSRGAYLGTLVAITIFGMLKQRMLIVGLALLVLTWQAVLPESVVDRIAGTQDASGQIEDSAAHRLFLWQHAKQVFADNIVFGVGFNGFGYTVPQGELTDTHNFYMKTASEQGMIGLIILGLVMLRAVFSGWRLYRIGQSDFHRGLGLGFLGCSMAVMVTNIFGDRWSYFMLGSYFWVFWGLVDRATTISQEKINNPAPEAAAEPAPATS